MPAPNSLLPKGQHHFLDIKDLGQDQLRTLIDNAEQLKLRPNSHAHDTVLNGKTLAMIFEKPSTRTRVSFEVGMQQLGGKTVVLQKSDMQLGRGESVADTARVLSRYVDAIMLRALSHNTLDELVAHSTVPVINALTDRSHPCQILADILTAEEKVGPLKGKIVTWVGDCNNVCRSWAEASVAFGFHFHLACPKDLVTADVAKLCRHFEDQNAAVAGASVVIADTFISMGAGSNTSEETLRKQLAPYQVNQALMQRAEPDAIFLHCLPATRGEEVTAEVIDGPQSAVWDEAENRLHAQKAVLCWCLGEELSWY